MRRIFLIVLAVLVVATVAGAESMKVSGTCEQCPSGAGCTASSFDGCNTTTFAAWCEGGRWFHGDVGMSTLIYCAKEFEFTPVLPFTPEK